MSTLDVSAAAVSDPSDALDPREAPARAGSPGRKAVISREDIIVAALRLVGPHSIQRSEGKAKRVIDKRNG